MVDIDTLPEDVADAVENSTLPYAAIFLFADNQHADVTADLVADAEDRHVGSAWSLTEWAEEYVADTGMLIDVPDDLAYYFDHKAWAEDAVLSGDIYVLEEEDGFLHIFHS